MTDEHLEVALLCEGLPQMRDLATRSGLAEKLVELIAASDLGRGRR